MKHPMSSRTVIVCLAAGAAFCTIACKSKAKADVNLPPATGPGAAARVALPTVTSSNGHDSALASTTKQTTGTTFPKQSAQLGPKATGVIALIAVEEGDRVKRGELMFRLDTANGRLGVRQAQAVLKSANVAVATVKVEYDRTERLYERKAIDLANWQRVQAQYDAAKAGAEQAEVGVSMAKKRLADATVRAPFTGLVTAKLKNVGDLATMMPPSVVLIVEDHSSLELRFKLPERSVGELAVGDDVRAEFAATGTPLTAKVIRISPNVDPRTRAVEVVAEIPNADGALKAGMLAKIRTGASQ